MRCKTAASNGVDFVKEAKTKYSLIEIILLTAYGNIPDGVQALKYGGFHYVTEGNDNDQIIPLLYQAIDKLPLKRNLRSRLKEKEPTALTT